MELASWAMIVNRRQAPGLFVRIDGPFFRARIRTPGRTPQSARHLSSSARQFAYRLFSQASVRRTYFIVKVRNGQSAVSFQYKAGQNHVPAPVAGGSPRTRRRPTPAVDGRSGALHFNRGRHDAAQANRLMLGIPVSTLPVSADDDYVGLDAAFLCSSKESQQVRRADFLPRLPQASSRLTGSFPLGLEISGHGPELGRNGALIVGGAPRA